MGIINSFFSGNKKHSLKAEKRIDNPSLNRLVPKMKEWKVDTVFVSTRNSCPVCSKYNRKIYSVYGWNKRYPALPDALLANKCSSCGGSIGFTFHFPELN